MDRFLEEVVTKHNRLMEEILYFASLALMTVCGVMGFFFFQSISAVGLSALLPTAVMIAIAVYLWFTHDKFRTEYEYTFTNGSLDFAMVFNNKKRKALGTLNIAKVDAFGKVQSGSFRRHTQGDVKHLRWFLNRESELYYLAFSKEGKKSVIVFEPSVEMVGYIKHYLPYGAHQEN